MFMVNKVLFTVSKLLYNTYCVCVCVCVCPVSPPKQCTCVWLCVVCDHNKLTYWPYLLLFHVYPQALQEEALEDGQVSDPVRARVIQLHGLGPRAHSAAVLHDWPTLERRRGEERRGEERTETRSGRQ